MKRIIRSLTGMSLVLLVVMVAASALSGIAWTGNPAGFQQEFAKNDEAPLFSEFKGVHIGLTADEARSKLGAPSDKGDEQDVFTLSEQNTAQVYYDKDKKVYAVSVFYIDAKAAPAPKSVFGSDVAPKADGSIYRMVRYPKAGYWVSYNRTAGADPMVTVTMQKM